MPKRQGIGTSWAHAKSMLRSMVTDLVTHERIETTVPRAKQLRQIADRMVTLGKMGDRYEGQRRANAVLRHPAALRKVFDVLGPRYAGREGGYTRVMRSRLREGDGAPMAFVEFIDRPGELRAARPPGGAGVVAGEAAAQRHGSFAASALREAGAGAGEALGESEGVAWSRGVPTKHGQGIHHVRWRRLGTKSKGGPKAKKT